MVSSLALCFDAPMQSWGLASRFTIRDTATEPTKSGVVGLLASALGVARDDEENIAKLAALRLGVRVDREGLLERDYHTTQNVPNTEGSNHRTVVSQRYYLSDALFLVVLEGEDRDLLVRLQTAVLQPKWPLFFGRKAFVPARPLVRAGDNAVSALGVVDQELDEVLRTHPWLETRAECWAREREKARKDEAVALRTLVECEPQHPDAEVRRDVPISFARQQRRYRFRAVRRAEVSLTEELIPTGEPACS
ncbi:type I-E CRISPR-associated protein Cas5/CasD [Streptoalloteichus hindustanus]|uniref:type I-E CRISPR-associated protein Cas5/CasD n=1 Tax=Streptoalloteichus hindustanus TaxID=2017 RepID=UPI001160ED20|nr:type I-E CRISPR-associated protein Cas5/CasD [Streptoalloteichus hindustanus]